MSPEWITGFGSNIYAFELSVNAHGSVPIGTLREWSKDDSFDYIRQRCKLLSQGFSSVVIEEECLLNAMGVVLDFDKIQNWRRYE